MPLPNRTWLLRARKQMCVNYQDLCGITMTDDRRKADNKGATYTKEQRDNIDDARTTLSLAIEHLNKVVGLPKGS